MKGSCNDGWIQFEICEDALNDATYFNQVYMEACELTAYLCKMYGIDPKGSVSLNGVTVPTILCHADSHTLGLGSNHGDVQHWFPKFGKNMDSVRADVAALMGISVSVSVPADDDVPTAENVADPEKTIWDYLMGKIGNVYGVAGLMGNLYVESGLRANNVQNSFEKKLGLNDETNTLAMDAGAYGNFVRDGAGYGLAQWTFWSRKQDLLKFAKEKGKSVGDLQMQMDFLWKELNTVYQTVLVVLQNADSVRQASDAVLLWYERPADQSDAVQVTRAGYGQGYYEKYAGEAVNPACGGMTNADCPFLVRVTIKDLNIRKGAGTDTAKTGRHISPGFFLNLVQILYITVRFLGLVFWYGCFIEEETNEREV